MRRRSFLQQAGCALTGLGLGVNALGRWGDRTHQVLAQSTPRKLALLVGINQYPQSPALNGCLTDVELQRELLQYRFGFQPSDILTLTDQAATRSNLENAFLSHLIEQAKPEDVVVFHFSGYGSYLDPGSIPHSGQTGLLPVDYLAGQDQEVNVLLEETLLLLLRSLPTDRITTILDTSYLIPPAGPTLQGNLRLRAKPLPVQAQPSAAALDFQAKLLTQFRASQDQARVARQSGQMPGIVLSAAGEGQTKAFEARWSGFSTGVFTHALTQYLWNSTPASIQVGFSRTSSLVEQLVGQAEQPVLAGQKSREQALLPYYVLPELPVGVAGVLTAVEEGGKAGRIWLGGLPAHILEYYSPNSLLTLVPATNGAAETLQLSTRTGLEARAHSQSGAAPLQSGQAVREWVRVLPRQISLVVALDAGLERIERVDATGALAGVAAVKSVVAGEQPADCLFGKIPGSIPKPGTENAPAEGAELHYALFSPGRAPLPGTQGRGGEAVKMAVQRLAQPFRTLLAAKLLRLTAQTSSAELAVRANLELVPPQEQVLLQQETGAIAPPDPAATDRATKEGGLISLKVGDRIRYRLHNLGNFPLYFVLLGLDTSGSLVAFTRGQVEEGKAEAIAPGETLTFPPSGTPFEWILREPAGLVETHLICSRAPLTRTQAALTSGISSTGSNARLSVPTNPLEVAQAVLQDLHAASTELATVPGLTPDQLALHVNAWAGFSFLYQVA